MDGPGRQAPLEDSHRGEHVEFKPQIKKDGDGKDDGEEKPADVAGEEQEEAKEAVSF